MVVVKLVDNNIPLLIHADPGGRAHFVATWLKSELSEAHYDVGKQIFTDFTKIHNDWNNDEAKKFDGIRIRIKSGFTLLATQLHLFLNKNVYFLVPNFTKDQFSFTAVEKLLEAVKGWWYHDMQVDYTLYDKIINFNDTYNTDYMIELFFWYNNKHPSAEQIEVLVQTNKLSNPEIDCNHSTSIAAMITEKEYSQGFKEIERYWSLKNIYETSDVQKLYETVYNAIVPENYGVSDVYGVGINDELEKRKNDI